jgi:hypothetical protein
MPMPTPRRKRASSPIEVATIQTTDAKRETAAKQLLGGLQMSSDVPPLGQRFSHVYIDRSEPQQDSPRMRRRLARLISEFKDLEGLGGTTESELGIPTRPYWTETLEGWKLKDVLDLITLAYRHLVDKQKTGYRDHNGPKRWLAKVQRILSEENVHYRVDDRGGVHFYFDQEFSHNHAATIAALQPARYANTLRTFEGSLTALSKVPPDGKVAIRETFAAIEGLFKLMFPHFARLGTKETKKQLETELQARNANDAAALRSSLKMLNSFAEWIDAAHFYRHEQGSEEIAQPPLELAVYIVSTGASHLRWLTGLDGSRK